MIDPLESVNIGRPLPGEGMKLIKNIVGWDADSEFLVDCNGASKSVVIFAMCDYESAVNVDELVKHVQHLSMSGDNAMMFYNMIAKQTVEVSMDFLLKMGFSQNNWREFVDFSGEAEITLKVKVVVNALIEKSAVSRMRNGIESVLEDYASCLDGSLQDMLENAVEDHEDLVVECRHNLISEGLSVEDIEDISVSVSANIA